MKNPLLQISVFISSNNMETTTFKGFRAITINYFKSLGFIFIFLALSVSVSAQSFVLNLQGANMSFLETDRLVTYDPGNNGGKDVGSIHEYSNLISHNGIDVYGRLTIVEKNNASINTFDDDAITGDAFRFQPRLGAGSGGGYILYKLEFFEVNTDYPVFLYNYYLTGVDIDGASASVREYYEISGFSSYTVDATTGLTISTNSTTGRTKFMGISSSLSGVTFDNTAAFISNYENPNNSITFLMGISGQNSERYFSAQFGIAGGTFTNPETTTNELPLAVDDIGTVFSSTGLTSSGGSAIPDILVNDIFNGLPVVPTEVTITEINPASNPGVVLNTTTGEVTVVPGTPVGVYHIEYQICMNTSPSGRCDIATITINVINPSLTITKVANQTVITAPGVITYAITVLNDGNTDLTNVVMTDVFAGVATYSSGDLTDVGVFNVEETWIYTASYTATQDDIDDGLDLVNTASIVTYELPIAEEASATTTITQTPSLTIVKTQTGGPNPVSLVGDVINYKIVVTNDGTQSLTNVVVNDILPDGTAGTLSARTESGIVDGILSVNETFTYIISYTVTQGDIDNGSNLVNTARVVTTELPTPEVDTEITPYAPPIPLSNWPIFLGVFLIGVFVIIRYKKGVQV